MNERVISRLEDLGVALFRINMSHTKIEDLEQNIAFIQACSNVPICLDTEGAQIRSGNLKNGEIIVKEHDSLEIVSRPIVGNEKQFSLYPEYIVDELELGNFISIDFNSVLLQVTEKTHGRISLRVLNGGKIGQNKAVTIERKIMMPSLTEKDKNAINIGLQMGIFNFALSFANFATDVDEIKELCGEEAFIISKIECFNGFNNLNQIAQKSNAILIDRGDLSREFPIERIPILQNRIIDQCKLIDRPVYVATNLLESMVNAPVPTRAEVNDIFSTLLSGADGLVLAAETAIGKWPVACANMVVSLVKTYETEKFSETEEGYDDYLNTLLIKPHGGKLIQREGTFTEVNNFRKIQVDTEDIMDCEQIANGTFSPIQGFMTQEELESVLENYKLPDGTVWTMPILLQLKGDGKNLPEAGEKIAITDRQGNTFALMDVQENFSIDLDLVALKWFGTCSDKHPGVLKFRERGSNCLSGPITLVNRLSTPYSHFHLSPSQARSMFSHKGWNRVVAFHTRNPAHRIHEIIQLKALELSRSDGLYISPIIGTKKPGDFVSKYILESYQILISLGVYPKGKVSLGSFATYSRYCGPREAVFTAISRKNMGCSHIIIGRDHTGFKDFYNQEDNKRLFEEIGEIGIKPIFFNNFGYDPKRDRYCEVANKANMIKISGTKVRESLANGHDLPDWFMRKEIQEMLREAISNGELVFHQ